MVDHGEDPPRVLIVSRLSLIGETVAAALAGHGVSIVRALGGEIATSLLAQEWGRAQPDVVVILSDLDSVEDAQRVCEWLHAVPGPSIVLTSTPPGAEWGAALRASASGVLPESTGLVELVTALDDVRRGHPLMDEATREELTGAWGAVREERERLLARMRLLSPRERTVLRLLYAGDSVASIAELLGVSEQTVRSQVNSILGKLEVHSQVAAVAMYGTMRRSRPAS